MDCFDSTASAPFYTAQSFDINCPRVAAGPIHTMDCFDSVGPILHCPSVDKKNCLSCWPTILRPHSAPTRLWTYSCSIPTCQLPHACGFMLAPFPVAAPHGCGFKPPTCRQLPVGPTIICPSFDNMKLSQLPAPDPQHYGLLRYDYLRRPHGNVFLKLRQENKFLSQLRVPWHHGICSDLVGPMATRIHH
jgi:hypothetical protein